MQDKRIRNATRLTVLTGIGIAILTVGCGKTEAPPSSLETIAKDVAELKALVASSCRPDAPTATTCDCNKMAKAIDDLKSRLDQQTAVLHRALGKQIPITLPDRAEKRLKDLETVISTPAQWPKSSDDTAKLQAGLAELMHEIPPWAEEQLLPRLNSVRWGIEVLWTLSANEKATADRADGIEASYRSLLEDAPSNSPKSLRDRLENERGLADTRANQWRHEQAMKEGKEAIQGKGDIAGAWNKLEPFASEKDCGELRRALRLKMIERAAEDRVKTLEATLQRANALANGALRRVAAARVYDAAIGVLLDLEIEDPRPEAGIKRVRAIVETCEKEMKELGRRQQEELDSKSRAYQAWALEQICKFWFGTESWNHDLMVPWVGKELKSFNKADGDKDWILFREFPETKGLLKEVLGLDLSNVNGSVLRREDQQAIYDGAYARVGWNKNIDREMCLSGSREKSLIARR